jgi:helicase
VNLPLRTLILYSTKRMAGKRRKPLERRTLKNLVGRVGRAGSETRGLVICVNESDWGVLAPVAKEAPLEHVRGGLARLLEDFVLKLARRGLQLSNALLERSTLAFGLVDAVDSLLVELMAEELGEDALREAALAIAADTFLATQGEGDDANMNLFRKLLVLRAKAVSRTFSDGRGELVRGLGIPTRTIAGTEAWFAGNSKPWQTLQDPLDNEWITYLVEFAWEQLDFAKEVKDLDDTYRKALPSLTKTDLVGAIRIWVAGGSYADMSTVLGWNVDLTLGTFARLVKYRFQVVVDRATTFANALADEYEIEVSATASLWAEHLRHGQPTEVGVRLAQSGLRHRSAIAFLAGQGLRLPPSGGQEALRTAAGVTAVGIHAGLVEWVGTLAAENTLSDLEVDPRTFVT